MNEILLLLTAICSMVIVYLSRQFGRERLYSAIVIFLLLIPTVGGKIVPFFGFETNTGNIFYASVFLATYFIIEQFGRKEGVKSVWIGAAAVVAFIVLTEINLAFVGSDITEPLSEAQNISFGPSIQIAIASIAAYIISQSANIQIYIWLKEKWNSKHVWLRANSANAVAQIVDSVVFFTIAFWKVLPPENLPEIIITGLVIKIGFMMVAAPLLKLNSIAYEEKDRYYSVSPR